MGFFNNTGSQIAKGTASAGAAGDFIYIDDGNWILCPHKTDREKKIEQFIRRVDKNCMPFYTYMYMAAYDDHHNLINKKDVTPDIGVGMFSKLLIPGAYRISKEIDGESISFDYRGWFDYYDFFNELWEKGWISDADMEKDYDPSYCVFDMKYLQEPDYKPSIIK